MNAMTRSPRSWNRRLAREVVQRKQADHRHGEPRQRQHQGRPAAPGDVLARGLLAGPGNAQQLAGLAHADAGDPFVASVQVTDSAPADLLAGCARAYEGLRRRQHERLAAVPTAGVTALQALRDLGRLERGQRVLVVGASGGVGSFAVPMAKAYGAEVTGVDAAHKKAFVRQMGADHF